MSRGITDGEDKDGTRNGKKVMSYVIDKIYKHNTKEAGKL